MFDRAPRAMYSSALMKLRLTLFPALIFALIMGACASARAQTSHTVDGSVTSTPISAGKVVGVSMNDGIMVMNVGATGRIISFYGMDRVPITTASGQPAALASMEVGMSVSVYYVNQKGHLYIARAVIPDPVPPKAPVYLTRAQRRAAASRTR
jgi:hypothetical protein